MNLKGEEQLPGTPEQIWDFLQDPEVLVSIMPGCEKLELVAEDQYEGIIKAKLGPISSQYKATFKLEDKNPPESYRLILDGNGPAGFVNANTRIELEAHEEGTLLKYEGTANVGGKVASIGQRLVETGAKFMIGQGFKALKKEVTDRV